MRSLAWAGALLAGLTLGGCDEPCCQENADCVDGARCFEGTCALRCEADRMCAEGEVCAATGVGGPGVCREAAVAPGLARCAGGAGAD